MVNIKFVDNRAAITIYRNGQRYQLKQTISESFEQFRERIQTLHPEFFNDINWDNEPIVREIKEKKVRESSSRIFDIEFWKNRFPELDFSEFVYEGCNNKSVLKCSIHGKFLNSIRNLSQINGNGCPECSRHKSKEFIRSIVAKPNLWQMNHF